MIRRLTRRGGRGYRGARETCGPRPPFLPGQWSCARLAAVGPPEKVLARYDELRKAGVTIPVVWLPVSCPPELALETIHTFIGD